MEREGEREKRGICLEKARVQAANAITAFLDKPITQENTYNQPVEQAQEQANDNVISEWNLKFLVTPETILYTEGGGDSKGR
jgi:hypothetical protein